MRKGRRVLLIFGACILVILNVLAVYVLLEDGAEHLPKANRNYIGVACRQEIPRQNGGVRHDFRAYEIPADEKLYADYSKLIADMKLYPSETELKVEFDANLYQISYENRLPEGYQSIRLLFEADTDIVQVTIDNFRGGPSSVTVYEVKNMDRWRNKFFKLVQKSEAYRVKDLGNVD